MGVGIGAVIHNWVPENVVVKVLGTGNPFGVIIATIAGVPMYADIFGCIPIAEALLAKGAKLGVGCRSCHEMYENIKKTVKAAGIGVEAEYVTDMERVMTYEIMSMPGS